MVLTIESKDTIKRKHKFYATGPRYNADILFCFQVAQFDEWKQGKNPLSRLCHTCRLVKPFRTKHCRTCNRCVLHFDHHCPYIYNCVGLKNRYVTYTERQKKLIISSERHTLKSKALKLIIIGHRLAILLLAKHI